MVTTHTQYTENKEYHQNLGIKLLKKLQTTLLLMWHDDKTSF